MQLFGRNQRESFAQIVARLQAEIAARARACAVGCIHALFKDQRQLVMILLHRHTSTGWAIVTLYIETILAQTAISGGAFLTPAPCNSANFTLSLRQREISRGRQPWQSDIFTQWCASKTLKQPKNSLRSWA